MDLITSHTYLDFDGLASAVAARILYPNSKITFPGRMNPDVRDFTSLYKDHLQITPSSYIQKDKVERLILVDCRPDKRLGPLLSLVREEIPIIIYDHHQEEEMEERYTSHIASVGATTTILVEEIRTKAFPLTPFLATLFLLGIYADTGSLRYPTTTPRDTEVVTYLLKEGGNLEVVDEFLRRPLSHEQQVLLNRLMEGGERHTIEGITVQIFTTSCKEYVPGINRIIQELKNLIEAQVLITLVAFERGVSILGRSKGEYVDLSSLFAEFGGGGHPGAAAAFVKGGKIVQVRKRLFSIMQNEMHSPCTAVQIMSNPVHTIRPEDTMKEAQKLMYRLGHSGLVVMENEKEKESGEVVGVISRRDIEKGRRHNLEHAPVKAFMSSSVLTITEDTPLHEIQKIMMENDVGRLPVLDRKRRLLGIVTRSDIVKNTFPWRMPTGFRSLYGSTRVPGRPMYYQLQDLVEDLPSSTKTLLEELGRLAQKMEASVYLIGGFVRDLLLGQVSSDLDLVLEGDSKEYARLLVEEMGGEILKESRLGTVEMRIGENFHLDVAISRLEYYEEAGSLPEIESATLEEDLFRRDFTINALALSLNPQQWGVFIDFFHGLKDLKEGRLRVLHNFSFIDDPLRILRGVRFAGRYGFTIERHTRYLITASLHHQVLEKVSPPRLTHEVILLFQEEKVKEILLLVREVGLSPSLFPEIERWDLDVFDGLPSTIESFHSICTERSLNLWLIRLMLFFNHLNQEEMGSILSRLSFNSREEKVLAQIPHLNKIFSKLEKEVSGSEIFSLLQGLASEELVYLSHLSSGVVRERVGHFLATLCQLKPSLTGKDLLEMGFKPGPEMGALLLDLKKARLDGLLSTRKEELSFLREYIDHKRWKKRKE